MKRRFFIRAIVEIETDTPDECNDETAVATYIAGVLSQGLEPEDRLLPGEYGLTVFELDENSSVEVEVVQKRKRTKGTTG